MAELGWSPETLLDMDVVRFGRLAEAAQRKRFADMGHTATTLRIAFHADDKAWQKFTRGLPGGKQKMKGPRELMRDLSKR